ncbi:PREDICTED: cyclin-A3-2-like [Camelina sativa]|uniref:Cyclin-A3-2-like n=1 Tax=Camelina sativa TaxID=90675 RepID=A0ABM0X185_CAMSA|nr:PREDICTED: cyclin-A3-2-like [Camelina sativa]
MTKQEICVRITRAAAKRKASMGMDEDRVSKKRVVLGELLNGSNVNVLANLNQIRETQKPKKSLRPPSNQIKKTAPVVVDLESQPDIDSRSDDPQMCGPYVGDIYQYLRELEVKPKQRPLPDYIEKVQKDVTASMRGVLVDWLVEIAEEYKLGSETLYLTVSHIDRFLSFKTVNKQRLQLVGVSAMLIASKYEEISPPKVEDFCYITDNTFTKQDVVKMEADILLALQFELGRPTINTFMRRFTRVAQEDFKVPHLQLEPLCCYLSELSILDYKAVKFVPSMLAASAVFLARFIIRPKQHPWNQMLEEYTKYKAADLQVCVGIIHDLYLSRRGGALQAVREKYKHHKFQSVATMPVSPELPVTFWEDVTI